jgi:glycerol uptake facilitator-like aquaporin
MGFFDGDHCIFKSRKLKSFDGKREAIEVLFEFIGMTMFAFFGSLATSSPAVDNGVAITVSIYCIFMVSGGKLNPVVSLVAMLLDLFTTEYKNDKKQLLYIVSAKLVAEISAQVAGSVAGTAAARYFAPHTMLTAGVGCFYPAAGVSPTSLMAFEGVATFTLVLVVLSLTAGMIDDNRVSGIAPFVIGATVYLVISTIGPFTGGCLNPARYAGAYYAGECDANLSNASVFASAYILGEFFGATAAFLLHMVRVRIKEFFSCGGGAPRGSRPAPESSPPEKPFPAYNSGGDGSFITGFGSRPAFHL